MVHTLPLLLALSIAPAATPVFDPAAATTGAVLDQTARTTTTYDRSSSLVGASGSSTIGGMPTYGATSSNVNTVSKGRTDLGGGQFVDWYIIQIASSVTGSGFAEQFIVFMPTKPKGVASPLLVAFHGFGHTQKDVTYNTTFVSECAARGWYMMAPLSASGAHFMCDPGQKNTEVAMDWMMSKFTIDKSRIYGVGFSMGGGMALNFAARHLDPSRWTFAAIVNHTGSVDLIDTYENDPSAQFVFDFWYGDESPGSADYDLMRRGSVIEWDPINQMVDPDTDIVRNLSHVPLKCVRATNDPLVGLTLQHDRLDQHLQSLGRVPGPSYSYELVPANEHKWKTLDETSACDFLAQFSLNLPTEQRTIAATGGYYFNFLVQQSDPKLLSPFTWEVDTLANELRVSETANLASLTFLAKKGGLNVDQPMSVVMSTADGLPKTLRLSGFNAKPVSVVRDGVALPATHWSYNASGGVVTLTEWDGANVHAYSIQP